MPLELSRFLRSGSPIYTKYQELAKQEAQNVIFGGRLGQYRYYNMDQVISGFRSIQRLRQQT